MAVKEKDTKKDQPRFETNAGMKRKAEEKRF